MTEYTRVTIQGEGRKADLVLPDDEPIAAVLPEVLSLLDETTERSSRPVVLMTTVGEQLAPGLTLAEQNVEHGTILRLVRVDEAPPPPEVADVTDLMGDAVDTRSDRWQPAWGTAIACTIALAGTMLGAGHAMLDGATQVQLAIAIVVLIALAIVAARRDYEPAAMVLTAAAIGCAYAIPSWLIEQTGLEQPGATLLFWFALTVTIAGMVGIIGFADRALAVGSVVGVLLTGLWVLLHHFNVDLLHSAAWIALAAVVLLGVLPGIAMSASGLTGLDDRVVEGQRVSRTAVNATVNATHRALSFATVAAAIPAALATWLLASSQVAPARWLALAVAVVLLCRTQVLPLAPQRVALIAAATVALVTDAMGRLTGTQLTLAFAALIVVLSVLVVLKVSENIKARFRGLVNIVEMVAIIAMLPLLLWLLGLYADLIGRFG